MAAADQSVGNSVTGGAGQKSTKHETCQGQNPMEREVVDERSTVQSQTRVESCQVVLYGVVRDGVTQKR